MLSELIQIAIGQREKLSQTPSEEEWAELFMSSKKQAVAGLVLLALDKLSVDGQKPPTSLLFEWIGCGEQIKQRNRIVNKRCAEITKLFADAGFRSCILKGQGNARMYPEPLLRTPGDIDIWVEGSRDEIRDFVMSRCPDAEDGDLHIEFPVFGDVPVEVHYMPGYSRVPKYDRRQQSWFKSQAEKQFSNHVMIGEMEVCVPTAEFNAVYQMHHMMRHFVVEGIGMRHLIDYYFVLKALREDNVGNTGWESTFRYLGIGRFASGVMWIEKEILGADEEILLVPSSESIGRIILDSVMEGGNFGHYRKENEARKKSVLRRGMIDGWRMMKIMPVQPSEVFYRLMGKIGNVKSMREGIGR